MANFCLRAIFILIPLFLLFIIGGSVANPDWSKKSYAECHELSGSKRFNEMIVKLQGQIPLLYTFWEDGHAHLLTAIQHFMDEIVEQKRVLKKDNKDDRAKNFLEKINAVSLKILSI
jgi:hypothetical protein